tara:strand:- start:1407 stop:1643 length:237 start_codon:yes stop_codon:yes gene_type:complete
MSHPVNTEIFENLIENYQIYKMTVDYHLKNDSSIIRYVIKDENEALIRHNNMSFFPTKEDAKKALNEIINQKFEEVTQ